LVAKTTLSVLTLPFGVESVIFCDPLEIAVTVKSGRFSETLHGCQTIPHGLGD
jgi:hypothetical protein